MTLTNYWWLLIWLFTGGIVLATYFPKHREMVSGKMETRWGIVPAVLMAVPYIVWAGCRNDGFGDTAAYRMMYKDVPASLSQISEYLSEHTKDKGFSVLMSAMKSLIGNNDMAFFIIVAIFQMICVVWLFRKYSSDYWLSMFMFVISTDYLSWMFNGIRQFIAVAIVQIAIGLVIKKKNLPAILLILLASTIHGSALIMIPIIFVIQGKAWNRKTILMLLATVAVIVSISKFTSFLDSMLVETQYSDLITNEIWINDDGTNIFRVLFYSIPALMSVFGRKYVDEADDRVINISVNCSAVTAFLYLLARFTSGIYIGRLPIYTTLVGYICVPWLINHMFYRSSARLVKNGLIVGYLAFFYYQMHMTWQIL